MTALRAVALLLTALWLASCAGPPAAHVAGGATMGTSWSAKLVGPGAAGLAVKLQDRLDELEALLSTYRADSQVSRFNASGSTDWFAVSEETAFIVAEGLRISAASDGAFDMTVGPLVDLWGFGPNGEPGSIPEAAEIEQRLAQSGYRGLEARLAPPAIRRTRPGLRVDLSAIAKGYAVDALCELLDAAGVEAYMIEVGGEIRTRGRRPDGLQWQIALERPVAGAREVRQVVGLSDRAVATSGDYRNFFEANGRRYSHTIDPRTGRPVTHRVGAVSVIDQSALRADAWATALMVLGADEGLAVANREGVAASLVLRTADGFEARDSEAFAALAMPDE